MQNLRQGIFTIDRSSLIQSGYSPHLKEQLELAEIAQQNPLTILFEGSNVSTQQIKQMQTVLLLVGEHKLSFELNEALIIREFEKTFPAGHQKIFQLDWNAMLDDNDLVEKIMVTLRDITSIRKIETEALQKRQAMENLLLQQKHRLEEQQIVVMQANEDLTDLDKQKTEFFQNI